MNADAPLRALTLWRPWPFAFFFLAPELRKDVENRPWQPWSSVLGKRIALHAGNYWHEDCAELLRGMQAIEGAPLADLSRDTAAPAGIVGTVRVVGYVWEQSEPNIGAYGGALMTAHSAATALTSQWFNGPFGWVVDEPRALSTPIACKGAQGLWSLSDEQRALISAREIR